MGTSIESKKTEVNSKLYNLALEAVSFIESNLTEPITVKEVTDRFEKSHWQFQRMFRSIVGISIGQYLRERRLSEAALQIKKTEDRILDIATQYDFGSQEAFARSFKNNFGVSPSEFRENENLVLREARNPVTPEKLQYFWNNIQRTPDLIQLESKLLVGTQVEFKSHFIEGSDCASKVPQHWVEFITLKKAIQNRVNKELVGVVLSSELELREEKLTYFSGVEVRAVTDLPENMVSIEIPGGTYACFENRGTSSDNGSLMDFIYGIWLPTSGHQRGRGFDLELFDRRYAQGNPDSISRFLIPITTN